MFNRQSKGGKLGTIAGIVVTVAFFLPWVKACGTLNVSGYDLANKSTGMVQDAWLYWFALFAGLCCIALGFLVATDTPLVRVRMAVVRMIAGGIGSLVILGVWAAALARREMVSVLIGLWIVTFGYIGIVVSFFMDIWSEE